MELLAGQRQKKESTNNVIACNDYLRMGPGRSLAKLIRKYAEDTLIKPPVKALRTVAIWCSKFGWVARADDYDSEIERQKTAYSEEMLRSGLALDYERVGKLKDLFELLYEQLMETGETGNFHNLWLPDVKQIGAGEYAERIDIERYNSPIITDIRGLLDDLAKETGGRIKRSELSGPEGGPVQVIGIEYAKPEKPEQDGK